MGEDERTENVEAAKMLEGRSIEGVDLDERWASLWLALDDGSTVRVDALVTGKLEIGYLSPGEAFEIDRMVMEEQIVDETIERLRTEGHLPALFDDRLEWVALPAVVDRDPDVAWLTHAARIEFENGVLRAYRVSDGRRHFDQGDVRQIFGAAGGSEIDEERIGEAVTRALTERERSGAGPERG